MKKFKNGDKVKIPTIGTACIRTSDVSDAGTLGVGGSGMKMK